jgi:hypothetical protein
MIIGGGILVHPPPEKRGQRQTKMVCLCGIATQKNLLSEFEILGTVKIKTGPSMNVRTKNSSANFFAKIPKKKMTAGF